jgi:5-methylcytosine-specific restriction endonuclease McrA
MAKRDYKKEYRDFHGKPKQRKRRSMTNQARRLLGLKKGDPREVDHIIPLSKGGTNDRSNLRAVSRSTNRKKGNGIKKKLVSKVRARKKK